MSLTEFEAIEKYFAGLTPAGRGVTLGIGDDAALLEPDPDFHLIVSTDTMVSGIHFFPDADPADVGYKALAVNLSDMAAMAAVPRWFTLALTLSETEMTHEWLDGFARGLAESAQNYAVSLVGGDLCKGPPAVTIQVIGDCPKGREIRRSSANAGDRIYVSGELGSAAFALKMLKSGRTPHPDCYSRLLRPDPRVEMGISLRGIASAMIDISDGLLADLGHLLDAGNVGAQVDIDAIPFHERLDEEPDPTQKWRCILSGGDDYELCFTVPPAKLQELERTGAPVYRIGEITAEQGLRCMRKDGTVFIPDESGYVHF
ncbi:MAG: thiamine-phosphate kinase [Gammaproteobacteria bacterium]|nr:thiamine-phosphate kinase [Gammaproteobacteria bacterium]